MSAVAAFASAKNSVTLGGMDAATFDDDQNLMLRYRDGDAASFEVLYAKHKGGVYRYLLRQCRDRAIAEELFQDVWLNLIRARASYTVQARFATYLYHIAHNRLIDHYRSTKREVPLSYSQEDDAENGLENIADTDGHQPDTLLAARQGAEMFLSLLENLPEPQREAFLLHEEGGLSVEEIAAATSTNAETAKSRLRYALKKLREGLKEVV
jgi:RNA polymerase sigma-70 factor, ECF subfamily